MKEPTHATYIPYRFGSEGLEFFLQKRDAHAPGDPNIFSTFGGHLDQGESAHEAMLREVEEELVYRPLAVEFLGVYEVGTNTFSVYFERVDNDFESKVDVQEGEYGAFLPARTMFDRNDISELLRVVLPPLIDKLSQ